VFRACCFCSFIWRVLLKEAALNKAKLREEKIKMNIFGQFLSKGYEEAVQFL